jgi:hypothetical protein
MGALAAQQESTQNFISPDILDKGVLQYGYSLSLSTFASSLCCVCVCIVFISDFLFDVLFLRELHIMKLMPEFTGSTIFF